MRKIHLIKFGVILSIFCFCSALAANQIPSGPAVDSEYPETLSSTSVSKKLYEIAYDLANSDKATYIQNEQAITFLLASMSLDNNSSDACSLLLKCACRFPDQHSLQGISGGRNYFDLVYNLLRQYVDENADIDIARNAAQYLVNQKDSAVQKQALLEQMLGMFAKKNPAFGSELATMLGMLKVQDNSPADAINYFEQACRYSKYNTFAFSRLVQLNEKQIEPAEYLERLRLDVRANPADIQTVLAFCQTCEQMQLYDTAANAYKYCSDLFNYLYPSESLPPDIYIPWSICCYNSKKQLFRCLEIAETVRKAGKFDIMLASLSGRAAGKLGEDQAAAQIIRDTEKEALELVNKNSPDVTESQLAWFYNFVIPMPAKAIEWSNRAYSIDPNSPVAASLLAYALTQNREFNTAMPLINNYERIQIADLTLAQIQLESGQGAEGIESLKRVISKDPGSFAAERAKEILTQNNETYVPPVNPDSVQASLEKEFGNKIIPNFTPPEKIFSASFNVRNKELSFGGNLDSVISIVNNSSEPLVIGDNSMFRGNIRVDAIVNGDMSRKFLNLVSKKISSSEIIEPGRSKIVNLNLITGELRNMLMTYPQASLNISFTLYLDPVQSIEDRVTNRLKKITPMSVTVTRPGVVITGQYLRDLVGTISTGLEGQKIVSGQLFVGLLKEQNALSGSTSPYHVVFSDGMNTMIKSALIYDSGLMRNPENGGWVVKVHTMTELLNLPLDYELIEAAAKNMYNEKWPVRMTAVYLLAESQGKNFEKVLDSISRTDKNQLVRDIAALETQKINLEDK